MNHLEPLSWPEPLQGDGPLENDHAALRRHAADMLSSTIRSTFWVAATFLDGCRLSAAPAVLAGPVRAAHELGVVTLGLLRTRPVVDDSLCRDWARCVDGLERLALSLSAGEPLPDPALTHALDTLIALTVQLDGTAGVVPETAGGRGVSGRTREFSHGGTLGAAHARPGAAAARRIASGSSCAR